MSSKLAASAHEDADGSWWSLELADTRGDSSRETVQRREDGATSSQRASLGGMLTGSSVVTQTRMRRGSSAGTA